MDRESLAGGLIDISAELREQLALMSAAAQLLERTAGSRERGYVATLNQGICRMLRTVTRVELAHRLTDENEIRSFPVTMDLAEMTEKLAGKMQGVLVGGGISLEWECPEALLICGDRGLLCRAVLELVSAAAEAGSTVRLSLTEHGDNAHLTVAAEGEPPARAIVPAGLEEEEALGLQMIRRIAGLHGGTLVTCLEGGLCRSLTAIVPKRLNMPASVLESPPCPAPTGGFDPVQVAFSHLLPDSEFLPEE